MAWIEEHTNEEDTINYNDITHYTWFSVWG